MTIILVGSCSGGGGQGQFVESVSGSPPVVSSGGFNPVISMPPATNGNDGYMTEEQVILLESLAAGGGLISGVAGENLGIGQPVYARRNPGTGLPELMLAEAISPVPTSEVVGITMTAALTGAGVTAVNGGQLAIPDAVWDPSPPTTFDVGERVYLSAITGKMTLTAPTITTHTVLRLGWVLEGGAGSVKLVVEFGEGAIL
jgi:hypothetical protein